MYANEVEISVPWGQITCKIWNDNRSNSENKTKNILLFIHNLHDNAASFDSLVNHLQEGICVAIDLPGHGKSSPVNAHAIYHSLDNIIVLKYVIYNLLRRYNKQNQPKKQIVLVGHGESAHLATIFTQVYPKFISKLILFDGMYNYGVKATNFVETIRKSIDSYFQIEHFLATKSPKEFTFENVVNTYSKYSNNTQIMNQTVYGLAERASRKIDNGNYLLKNDMRLNNISMPACGFHYMIDFLKKQRIQCPVLIICSNLMENEHTEFLNVLKMKNRKVTIVNVPFSNYHIEKPLETSHYLCKFLNFKISKL